MEQTSRHAVISLKDVRASYGSIRVLHGVSLEVRAGSVIALLGPNGAGKTSILKVATGQLRPDSGCVHVLGRHINGMAPDSLARAGICSIPEGRAVFPNLSVGENIRLMTYCGTTRRSAEDVVYGRFPRLFERRRQRAGTMSGGEQQMLAISRALCSRPAALVLDEISMGLAPRIVDELYRVVAQIALEGVAVLLSEQYTKSALSVADRVAVVSHGRISSTQSRADLGDAQSVDYLAGAFAGTASELEDRPARTGTVTSSVADGVSGGYS